MKSYKDLKVWQRADQWVTDIYQMTKTFPKEELYGLTLQLRRAAVSVPANIAEGNERQYKKEFVQFLEIAKGSLAEATYYIHLSMRLGYFPSSDGEKLWNEGQELAKMLNGLIKAIAVSKHK